VIESIAYAGADFTELWEGGCKEEDEEEGAEEDADEEREGKKSSAVLESRAEAPAPAPAPALTLLQQPSSPVKRPLHLVSPGEAPSNAVATS